MRTAIILITLSMFAVSWAGPTASVAQATDLPGAPSQYGGDARDLAVVWSQIQDFSGDFTANSSEWKPVTGYLCESAEDFYCESGDTIVRVDWWGHERDLPAGEGVAEIPEFVIRFYENDSTTNGGYDVPGALVYEQSVFDFTAEYLGVVDKFYYTSTVPGGFVPTAGETYWLSMLAVHPSTLANQQWYWYSCIPEDYWGAESTYKSEFWGALEWIPWSSRPGHVPFDHGFILYSRGDTPVEDKSWGQIKAMFR